MAYTVALIGYAAPSNLPDAADDAVDRFLAMLERQLDGRLIQALKAYRSASTLPALELSDEESRLARDWAAAYAAAREAGLHGLRHAEEARFVVQLS